MSLFNSDSGEYLSETFRAFAFKLIIFNLLSNMYSNNL